ncbi:S-protein homolog 29-like [Rhododendron vialii]|uniref:S-protein homolog 29-like n=1 Tax=Rhododendron vialii TaxID=182163 RepID=UPI0026600CD6|nr:S-protein homolog 29-like [Rhododendron vialii]
MIYCLSNTMKHFLFLQFLILSFFFVSTTLSSGSENRTSSSPPSKIHFTERSEVHIRSDLPNNSHPLYLRCQSGDTDFGMHKLYVGQEFYWKFRINPFGRTLYFCHFYWDKKQRIFNVFDKYSVRFLCVVPHSQDFVCIWKVREEAFYVSHDNKRFKKMHTWYGDEVVPST